MQAYVFTNIRELREKAGLSRRLVAERLFSVEGNWRREQRLAAREDRFADYEAGRKSTCRIEPVALFNLAVALECGVAELRFRRADAR